jgi:hypothetical protein
MINRLIKNSAIGGSMKKETIICGAKTQKGRCCRNRVSKIGDRCHIHRKLPASKEHVLDRCFTVIEKVAALGGFYSALDLTYQHIMSIYNYLGTLLMPEYFWHYGFAKKNEKRMHEEIKAAYKKRESLEFTYENLYSIDEKIKLEKAYNKIMREIEKVQ